MANVTGDAIELQQLRDEEIVQSPDSSQYNHEDSNSKGMLLKPKDNYYMVHLLFLLLGIMHLLPISFFYTANDYWMHKFRDTTVKADDAKNRSVLQSQFTSSCLVAQNVPLIICLVLSSLFGYKIKAKIRIVSSLLVLVTGFIVFTIFIKVNTDDWQDGFFALTMILLSIINGILALLQVTSLALTSKFPDDYMKTFLIGEGVGGVFICSLQVLSLAMGSSSESAAIIYFVLGTMVTAFTLFIFCVSQNMKVYRFYMEMHPEDTTRDLIKWKEVKKLSKQIWASLAIVSTCAFAYVPTHPSIAALVVSEKYRQGFIWNDVYFVAVITFLCSEIFSLLGRIISTVFSKTLPWLWLVIISVLRIIIFTPLFLFCNALPRHHLPVLFPHDWQYITILAAFMISSGYLFNVAFLNIEKLKSKQNEENALILMQTSTGLIGAVFSPLGVICVYLL